MTFIPRFIGKAIQSPEGWTWRLLLTALGETEGSEFKSAKLFSTKHLAIKDMKKTIKEMMAVYANEFPDMKVDLDSYIDLKQNAIKRNWKED